MRARAAPTDESTPGASQERKRIPVPLLISLGAIVLIIIHLLLPNVTVDTITLGLLIVAALPWLAELIQSAELPGGWKVEFREVKESVAEQKREIEHLRFLFTNFLTEWEITHLRKLASDQPFPFSKSQSFDQEMRRLRALRFIEGLDRGKGIRSMNSEHNGDVKNHFRITERGRMYLKLREDFELRSEAGT